METQIKVHRLGPIAAFDRSAHSVSQILLSHFFARYGVESHIYLRKASSRAPSDPEKLLEFLGIEPNRNFHIHMILSHKGISSAVNTLRFISNVITTGGKHVVFLSKEKHVISLSKLRRLGFKIVFENHEDRLCPEAIRAADLNYVVSPKVYERASELKSVNVKFWNYHYPVGENLFNIKENVSLRKPIKLGYVGTLIPEKGVDVLIRAIRNLEGFTLKVIGGTPEQVESLRKACRDYGVEEMVELTGFVDQSRLREELAGIDILVAPFRRSQKTIPLKIYEYLSTGIPCLVSRIPATETVAGESVFYFEPESEESLRRMLLFMAENGRAVEEKVRKARALSRKFHWKSVIEKILNDLEEI